MAQTPDTQRVWLPAPYEGLDVSQNPATLPQTKAWALLNWLVHEESRLPARGPVVFHKNIRAASASTVWWPISAVVSQSTFGSRLTYVSVTSRTTGIGANPKWHSHRGFEQDLSSATNQIVPDGVYSWVDPDGANTSNSGQEINEQAPGTGHTGSFVIFPGHYAVYEDTPYFISWQSANTVLTGQLGKSHYQSKLGFHSQSLGLCWIDVAPRMAQGVAAFADRLWVLGGTAPSTPGTGSSHKPSNLWFTNSHATGKLLVTDWQTANSITGVLTDNFIQAGSHYDHGMALSVVGRRLIVHKRNSTYVLTGDGPSSFAINQISSTIGLPDPRGRCTVDDTCFFLSQDGMYATDGVTVNRISGPVDRLLVPQLNNYAKATAPAGAHLAVQNLGDGYLSVFVGDDISSGSTASTGVNGFNALYHYPTGRWVLFQTDAQRAIKGLVLIVRVKDDAYSLQGGLSVDGYKVTNVPDALRHTTENERYWDIDYSSAKVAVPLICRWKPFRPGSPFNRMRLTRWALEYVWEVGTVPSTDALQVTGLTYTQNAAGTMPSAIPVTVLATHPISDSDLQNRLRGFVDWVEAKNAPDDIWFVVERNASLGAYSGTAAPKLAFLHGAAIEYIAPGEPKR